ncbi:MAG: DUF350 domain-containing protein [Thermodesulfobacteriota bacterium]|nr:DUF350 domain-containing protein [Thermodesulfobacteriota bacterium]
MDISIMALNIIYAIFGAVLTMVCMVIGYKIFDRITPFDTSRALAEKNIAVGIVVGSVFIGLGIAIGFVVGMGLN